MMRLAVIAAVVCAACLWAPATETRDEVRQSIHDLLKADAAAITGGEPVRHEPPKIPDTLPAEVKKPPVMAASHPTTTQAVATAAPTTQKAGPSDLEKLAGVKLENPVSAGDGFFKAGRLDEAVVLYEQAIKRDPNRKDKDWVLLQLGACKESSDPAAALCAVWEAAGRMPGLVVALAGQGPPERAGVPGERRHALAAEDKFPRKEQVKDCDLTQNVLLVTSDQALLRGMQEVLARRAVRGRVAATAAGVEDAQRGSWDLAVVDLAVTGATEAIARLRQDEPERPILAVGAPDNARAALAAIRQGCRELLLLPLDQEQFDRCIEALLPNHRIPVISLAQKSSACLYQIAGAAGRSRRRSCWLAESRRPRCRC